MHSKHVTPYNTGKLLIGINYDRPVRTDFTEEERIMQRVLLGQPVMQTWSAMPFYAYCVALTALLLMLGAWSVR